MEKFQEEGFQKLKNNKKCLLLRSLLIKYKPEEIVASFKTEEDYMEFIGLVSSILKEDNLFLLLRDYIEKTQLVISLGSEKFKKTKEMMAARNKHIIELNELKCTENKERVIDGYLGGEIFLRGYFPYTDEKLFNSMANDYFVATKLHEAIDGNNKLSEIDNHQFLESSSFFIQMSPELYVLYPESIDLTENEIDRILEEEPNHRRSIKLIKKNLSKLK